jgi:hypothetical protein
LVYYEHDNDFSEPPVYEAEDEGGGTPAGWGNGKQVTVNFANGIARTQVDIVNSGTGLLVVGTAYKTAGGVAQGVAFRLSATGALLTGFGTSGYAWVNTGAGVANRLDAVNGECAAGSTGTSSASQMLVACFTSTGFNTTFDGDGLKTIDMSSLGFPIARAHAILKTSTNQFLVGANICPSSGSCKLGFARMSSTGVLDTTFSGDGLATLAYGASQGGLISTTILPFGSRFLVTGQQVSSDGSTGDSFVLAFTSSGALDTTFAAGGVRTFNHSTGYDSYGELMQWGSGFLTVGDRDVFSPDAIQGFLTNHTGS